MMRGFYLEVSEVHGHKKRTVNVQMGGGGGGGGGNQATAIFRKDTFFKVAIIFSFNLI